MKFKPGDKVTYNGLGKTFYGVGTILSTDLNSVTVKWTEKNRGFNSYSLSEAKKVLQKVLE